MSTMCYHKQIVKEIVQKSPGIYDVYGMEYSQYIDQFDTIHYSEYKRFRETVLIWDTAIHSLATQITNLPFYPSVPGGFSISVLNRAGYYYRIHG